MRKHPTAGNPSSLRSTRPKQVVEALPTTKALTTRVIRRLIGEYMATEEPWAGAAMEALRLAWSIRADAH